MSVLRPAIDHAPSTRNERGGIALDDGARDGRAAPFTQAAIRFAMVALSTGLFLALFLRMVNYEMRRDEQLYVPPAVLLDHLRLYADFFYNHTPGSAWLFHAIHGLLGTDHLLLASRLGVFAGWLLFAGAIGVLGTVLVRSGSIAWSVAVLTLANDLFLSQTGMTATNNFLPLPLSFIGLGLFVVAARRERHRPWLFAASGFFLSAAVVFKLNALAFIIPAAAASLLLPIGADFKRRVSTVVMPFAFGGIVGGVPILLYLARDPMSFMAHVVGYHLGPHATYSRSTAMAGEGAVATLPGKLLLVHDAWLGGAIPAALVALGIVAIVRFGDGRRREAASGIDKTLLVFVVAAFLVSFAFGLLPTPGFPQYFAPPLICLPLALLLLMEGQPAEARRSFERILLAAVVVVGAAEGPRLAQYAGTVFKPERWTVMRIHADGAEIARRLSEAKLEMGKVATLAPIYPLEGGLAVYPELATGPFAYRTGDITPPDLARHYRMTSPSRIESLLDAEPPAAFLLGLNPDLEKPMLDYALAHGYRAAEGFRIEDRYGTALLYLRPAG